VVGDSQDPAIETHGTTRPCGRQCIHRSLATSSSDCTGPHEPISGWTPFPSCTTRAVPRELHHNGRIECCRDGLSMVANSPSSQDFPRGSLTGKDRIVYPALPGNSFSSTFAIACG
jgi:hypothetical protein